MITKGKGILIGVLSFIIGAGASLAFCTGGFRNWDGIKKQVQAYEESYNGLLANAKDGNGMSLLVASASTDGGVATATTGDYTINATVSGEGTFDESLTWSIGFANASSEWATGKAVADYITMTVAEDTHSVSVANKAPFGEPIIITATSNDDVRVSATCQLDYVKRVEGITELENEGITATEPSGDQYHDIADFLLCADGYGGYSTFTGNFVYGVGTLIPEVDMSFELCDTGSLWNELAEGTYTDAPLYYFDVDLTLEDFEQDEDFFRVDLSLDLTDFGLPTSEEYVRSNALHNDFKTLCDSTLFDMKVSCKFGYGNVNYGTFDVRYSNVYGSGEYKQVFYVCSCFMQERSSVESVSLDNSNVVF